MQQHYRIDLSRPGLLESVSSRWLTVRIVGLLTMESRLQRTLFPPDEDAP